MIVEDGTGIEGANSYVTLDEAIAYCAARGLAFAASPSDTGEQALIRATSAIDAIYRKRYSGYKTYGRDQSLEWPRSDALDAEDEEIASDEIPQEIINATIEAAVREYAEAGSMQPDLERGGDIRALSAGSVSIEYNAAASTKTVFQVIDGILSGLLGTKSNSFIATSVRG